MKVRREWVAKDHALTVASKHSDDTVVQLD